MQNITLGRPHNEIPHRGCDFRYPPPSCPPEPHFNESVPRRAASASRGERVALFAAGGARLFRRPRRCRRRGRSGRRGPVTVRALRPHQTHVACRSLVVWLVGIIAAFERRSPSHVVSQHALSPATARPRGLRRRGRRGPLGAAPPPPTPRRRFRAADGCAVVSAAQGERPSDDDAPHMDGALARVHRTAQSANDEGQQSQERCNMCSR